MKVRLGKKKVEKIERDDQNVPGLHLPILLPECVEMLDIKDSDTVIDCTVNRAGHSIEILKNLSSSGTLICIDLDQEALTQAKENTDRYILTLSDIKKKNLAKVYYINDNFANIKKIISDLGLEKVNKIFADLGISSQEIDISGRGFTFQKDEPLLMTFKSVIDDKTLTAKEIVNSWGEKVIADIIYNFADERYSRNIAKKIVEYRKEKDIETTLELVDIIKKATPFAYHKGKTHFATRTFQGLRMAVNKEVDSVITLIKDSKDILTDGGRLVLITFHSTEDRIVKLKAKELDFKSVNKKPITPNGQEIAKNIRSRSAKLRAYEKKHE
jgi:16S rRNA (cytosine1402-N4)-methyltransferase